MSIVLLHHNESIFPQSHSFLPERWLAQSQGRRLEKYMVSFGKGSRQCLGMEYVYLSHFQFYISIFICRSFVSFEYTLFFPIPTPILPSKVYPLYNAFPFLAPSFVYSCSRVLKPTRELCRLSYAELYLTLALLFRTVDMELFDTTRADVDIAYDWLAPHPRKDTKGVRVLIK